MTEPEGSAISVSNAWRMVFDVNVVVDVGVSVVVLAPPNADNSLAQRMRPMDIDVASVSLSVAKDTFLNLGWAEMLDGVLSILTHLSPNSSFTMPARELRPLTSVHSIGRLGHELLSACSEPRPPRSPCLLHPFAIAVFRAHRPSLVRRRRADLCRARTS